MKIPIVLVSIFFLVHGLPTAPSDGTTADSFPWMTKASKGKTRFGTTPSPKDAPLEVPVPDVASQPPTQPALTPELLQSYIAVLTSQLQSLTQNSAVTVPTPKRFGKVPKDIKPDDGVAPTTASYWDVERKEYPDSLYDEFYLDWLRKRQIEEVQVSTPNPVELPENANVAPTNVPAEGNPTSSVPSPQVGGMPQPYPTVPLAVNPFANPFLYPFGGLKVSKVMAQAQVNAALAAWNITTTAKPMKIKLKVPIPPGADLAQVVSAGIAAFPAGTTYDLSKK